MAGVVQGILEGAAEEGEMLTITIEVNAPAGMAQAVKEDLAMLVERYGDTRVVKVEVSHE